VYELFVGGNPPLLDAPIFKNCLWSTEFFQNSETLDSLFADELLTEYFPFIDRLHQLNEIGALIQQAVPFESLPAKDGNPNAIFVWGCLLRFLVLDMLLCCKSYKPSPHVPPDGNAIPKSVLVVSRFCTTLGAEIFDCSAAHQEDV
jgi:hypothetical protein